MFAKVQTCFLEGLGSFESEVSYICVVRDPNHIRNLEIRSASMVSKASRDYGSSLKDVGGLNSFLLTYLTGPSGKVTSLREQRKLIKTGYMHISL